MLGARRTRLRSQICGPDARRATLLPPGPRAPRLAQAWRYAFDQPRFFAECRERYGSAWTLRLPGFPPAVPTTDRDAIRALFTGDPLTKRHGNDLLEFLFGPRSLVLLEPAEHLARRRLELAPFHGEHVRSYTDRIRERTEREVGGWSPGTVVEVHPRAQGVTLGVIIELVLGVRDPRLAAELAAIFSAMNRPQNNLGLFLPRWLLSRWNPLTRPFLALLRRLDRLLLAHIASARDGSALAQRDDVLSLLVLARDEQGAGLTDAELRDELVTLVSAGFETTATAIAWAADLLAHNPGVASRLREELSTGDRAYLQATAKEVLRARTVVPVSAARHPLEPVVVGGYEIGREAVVLVDAGGLHADPALHPDPESFRPERFLDGAQPEAYAYVPFGGGAHRCLGAALATLELELAIEAMVTRWELAPAGPPASPTRRGVTLAPDNRGSVQVSA